MSAHLLQISAERLAALPEGALARVHESGWDGRTFKRCSGVVVRFDHAAEVDTVYGSAWLVLTDTLTAAAVAARVVRPWQTARYNNRSLPDDARFLTNAELSVLERAEMMLDLSADDLDTLARLARAAMEVA